MDRKKVIKGLLNDIDFVYNDSSKHETLSRMLDELLKEREAVEPLPQNSNGWVRTIKLWYCGACHSKISRRTSKYCPNCGKPILWKGR